MTTTTSVRKRPGTEQPNCPRTATEPADGRMVLFTDRRGIHTKVLIRSDRDADASDYPSGQRWFEIDPDSVTDPVTYDELVNRTTEQGGTLQLLAAVKVLVAPPAR